MLQRVLDADAERREQQRAGEALLVHHLQARLAVAVLRAQRLELAERLDDRLLLRVAAVPVVQRAGLGHRVEGRVGDVGVDRAAHEQPAPAVDVGPPHAPVAQRAVPVPGERVLGLVVVVVEVEDPRLGRLARHRRLLGGASSRPCRCRRPRCAPATRRGHPRGVDVGRERAERPDGRLVLRGVGERVPVEEPARVLPGDLVDLLVGATGVLELAPGELGRLRPRRVGVRVVALPGDVVDADPVAELQARRVGDVAGQDVLAEHLGRQLPAEVVAAVQPRSGSGSGGRSGRSRTGSSRSPPSGQRPPAGRGTGAASDRRAGPGP